MGDSLTFASGEIARLATLCMVFVGIYSIGIFIEWHTDDREAISAGEALQTFGLFGIGIHVCCIILISFLMVIEKMAAVIMHIWR